MPIAVKLIISKSRVIGVHVCFILLAALYQTSIAFAANYFEPANNSPSGALELVPFVAQSHENDSASDRDWFYFELDESQCVTVSVSHTSNDLALTLYDSENQLIKEGHYDNYSISTGIEAGLSDLCPTFTSDSGYFGRPPIMVGLPAGKYFVEESYPDIFGSGAYTIEVQTFNATSDEDQYENNNDIINASRIRFATTQQHNIFPDYDEDFIEFILREPAIVTVVVKGDISKFGIRLDDQFGQTFGNYPDCPISRCEIAGQRTIVTKTLYAGRYYVRVKLYDNVRTYHPTWKEQYTVRVTATPSEIIDNSDPYEPDNSPSQANYISNSEFQIHTLGRAADRDWYVFEIDQCLVIVPQLFSTWYSSLKVLLINEDLEVIAQSQREQLSQNQLELNYIEQRINPGKYYARVDFERYAERQSLQGNYAFRLLAYECPITLAPIIDLLLEE